MSDLEAATVEFVAPDRRTGSLAAYDDTLTEAQRTALQAVAMNMWPAYVRARGIVPSSAPARRRPNYVWLRSDEHLTSEQADALALLHTPGPFVHAWPQ